MKKFYYPQNVAVVGVSDNPTNLGQGIILNLQQAGYQGKIFPVGRREGTVSGLPIYTRLEHLPEPADLVGILPVPHGFDAEHAVIQFSDETLEIRVRRASRGDAR